MTHIDNIYEIECEQWIAFASATIFMVILIPNELRQVYAFHKEAPEDKILRQRYPEISVATSISLITLTFGSLLFVIYQSNILNISTVHSSTWYIVMTFMAIVFSCVECAAYTLAFRFWIIYYQIQLSSVAQSQKWRILIDSKSKITDIGNTHGQWFINHKKNFGNYYFCKKIFSICAIVGSITTTGLFLA